MTTRRTLDPARRGVAIPACVVSEQVRAPLGSARTLLACARALSWGARALLGPRRAVGWVAGAGASPRLALGRPIREPKLGAPAFGGVTSGRDATLRALLDAQRAFGLAPRAFVLALRAPVKALRAPLLAAGEPSLRVNQVEASRAMAAAAAKNQKRDAAKGARGRWMCRTFI